VQKHFFRAVIEDVEVAAEDRSDINRERGIHDNRDFGDGALAEKLSHIIKKFLRALHRETRNNDFSTSGDNAPNRVAEGLFRLLDGRVQAVTVSGFDYECPNAANLFRVAKQGKPVSAEVDDVSEAIGFAVFFDFQFRQRASEDVPRVAKTKFYFIRRIVPNGIRSRREMSNRIERVLYSVYRLLWRKPLVREFFINEFDVVFVQIRRVGEHIPAKVFGGIGAKDGAVITVFHENRQVAGVVNVRVSEYYGV
jgi:hypothetical protein